METEVIDELAAVEIEEVGPLRRADVQITIVLHFAAVLPPESSACFAHAIGQPDHRGLAGGHGRCPVR